VKAVNLTGVTMHIFEQLKATLQAGFDNYDFEF